MLWGFKKLRTNLQLNKNYARPIYKIWSELKVEDDYGVCSLELHRKFTKICYNLRYRPSISDP
jgi:hypothetical protein